MSHDKYARIISAAMSTPWVITPEKAMVIRDILQFRASGGRLSADELRARIGPAMDDEKPTTTKQGLTAVIPVWGVIANRNFDASSGMTSCEWVSAQVKRAVNDDGISAGIIDFNTPGGAADGVPELAAEIAAACKVKPFHGISHSIAASGGYWLASQCTSLSIIPSGYVGSIGVFMLTEDWSEYLAKEGIKIVPIQAGDNKLEGNWWEPLSEDAKAHYQSQVDEIYADFLKAVARGRGVTVAHVKKQFGQGRCYGSTEALARGMVDRVETFDQLIARVAGGGKRRGGGARAEGAEPTRLERLEERRAEGAGAEADEPRMALAADSEPPEVEANPVTTSTMVPAASVTTDPVVESDDQAALDRDLLELARAR